MNELTPELQFKKTLEVAQSVIAAGQFTVTSTNSLQNYSTPLTIGEFKLTEQIGRRRHSHGRKPSKSITLANGDIITTTNRNAFGSITLEEIPRHCRVTLSSKQGGNCE